MVVQYALLNYGRTNKHDLRSPNSENVSFGNVFTTTSTKKI